VGLLNFLFGKKKATGASNSPRSSVKNAKRVNIDKRFQGRVRHGQGSMSRVFRTYDSDLGRNVCLKLLDKLKTAKFEERFKGLNKPSEGEVCMALRHDNVVRTFEYGLTTAGEPYLVMEWVDGLGLNYLIETRSPQLTGRRIEYLGQLCNAVQYMHDNKWLHRDLCPRTVMVDKEGVLKLIDFGLTIPYTPPFCAPGNRTGTPDYLPPELVMRKPTDHRVDMYALGVTAFEVFTSALPWERTPSSEENFRRRLNTPPRNPKELNPKLGDDVVALLLKSISKEPQDRFASARQFKDALEALKRQDY
jgi:serine/threonine protein kinase